MTETSPPEATLTAPDRCATPLHVTSDLGEEGKLTSHAVLAAFDSQKRGLEILHRDLFDGSSRVVLSALTALGKARDPRSLKFVYRVLTQNDEALQCAAVKTAGDITGPGGSAALFNFLKVTKSDKVRCAVLEALSRNAPENGEVLKHLREYAYSPLVSGECRAFSAALLVKIQGAAGATQALAQGSEEVAGAVYSLALQDSGIAGAVVQHGLAHYQSLSAANRGLLMSIVASCPCPGSAAALLAGIQDADPQVRKEAYQALGQSDRHIDSFGEIARHLCEHADPFPILEEEVLAAIQRMEQCLAGRPGLSRESSQEILGQVRELFKVVSSCERAIASDSHELGWLIARSREYLEYYADEDLRKALVSYLKGGSYYTAQKLLAMVKASAVKVEVRHFDGFRAIEDIVKTPDRRGMGLLSRELAIAKLGKRQPFYRLIHALLLTRLSAGAGPSEDRSRLFSQIFSWATQARLFRLAEAALYALGKADVEQATRASRQSLELPLVSKICAIAGIHLLKELRWDELAPSIKALLENCTDSHVLLNLVDAFSSQDLPVDGLMVKAMVNILLRGTDREVLARVADFLGFQSSVDVFESLREGFERAELWRQGLIVSVIERKVVEGSVTNREGLIEFLYRILRGEPSVHQSRAAALLLRLGDDYAAGVLPELLLRRDVEAKIAALRGLRGALSSQIASSLAPLLRLEHVGLHEALRETLLSVEDPQTQSRACDLLLAARGEGTPGSGSTVESGQETEAQIDFFQQKSAYRFEREHVQELAVLFTDIQGYSRKAQTLDTMQLASMIRDYEGILLPTMSSHGGELIKRMGDGHLFTFPVPLNSVMAAIRLQKALKRFNSYREEKLRLAVRVGIHWGQVVCEAGDVLGNHVNIASRLESSAKPGSLLISETLYRLLGGNILAKEIGLINVKGFSDPIKVYEPYEIVIDLPENLDPLKSATRETHREPGPSAHRNLVLDKKTLDYIVDTFGRLERLCRQAEAGKAGVQEVRLELNRRWMGLKEALRNGMKH